MCGAGAADLSEVGIVSGCAANSASVLRRVTKSELKGVTMICFRLSIYLLLKEEITSLFVHCLKEPAGLVC